MSFNYRELKRTTRIMQYLNKKQAHEEMMSRWFDNSDRQGENMLKSHETFT